MNFAPAFTPRRLAALAAAMLAIPLMQAAPAEASASAGVSLNALKITGDGLSDKVALRLRPGDATTLDLDFGDDGFVDGGFARSTFNRIAIDMGGGGDSVRIDDSGGVFTDTETTEIRGGDGNDDLRGGGGIESLVGGGGEDIIAGGAGIEFPEGGPGNDTFIWRPLDDDDVVAGDDGADRLLVEGSDADEQIQIDRFPAPNDGELRVSRTALSRAGGQLNALRLVAVEKLELDALGGDDSIVTSPDVGALMSLDIDAGSPGSGEPIDTSDDDVVVGSDAADVITGGLGADRLDGRGGADTLRGDFGDDTLIGGSGSDAMTGGEGSDAFQCDGPGEVLDPQPEDLFPAVCIPSAPPVEPAPAPAPPAEATVPAPAPGATGLPIGFLGFGKPAVRATREGLRVTLTNVHSAPVELKLATSERFRTARGARTARYRLVQKTIPAGARATLRLRASRALRRQIAAQLSRVGRVVRRPSLTVTNVATGGKRSVRPRLTFTRR